MTQKTIPEILITPAEICDLSERAGTVTDGERGVSVAREFMERRGACVRVTDTYEYYWMLAAVYQAGRIQGIREERRRKKQ